MANTIATQTYVGTAIAQYLQRNQITAVLKISSQAHNQYQPNFIF